MSVLHESGLLSDVSGLGKGVFEQVCTVGIFRQLGTAHSQYLRILCLANLA
jgi:hypothetical protein